MRRYSEEITVMRDFGNKENEIMLLDTINGTAGGKRYERLDFEGKRPNVSISTYHTIVLGKSFVHRQCATGGPLQRHNN